MHVAGATPGVWTMRVQRVDHIKLGARGRIPEDGPLHVLRTAGCFGNPEAESFRGIRSTPGIMRPPGPDARPCSRFGNDPPLFMVVICRLQSPPESSGTDQYERPPITVLVDLEREPRTRRTSTERPSEPAEGRRASTHCGKRVFDTCRIITMRQVRNNFSGAGPMEKE